MKTETRECPRCGKQVTLAPQIKAVWAYHWPPPTVARSFDSISLCTQSGRPLESIEDAAEPPKEASKELK